MYLIYNPIRRLFLAEFGWVKHPFDAKMMSVDEAATSRLHNNDKIGSIESYLRSLLLFLTEASGAREGAVIQPKEGRIALFPRPMPERSKHVPNPIY